MGQRLNKSKRECDPPDVVSSPSLASVKPVHHIDAACGILRPLKYKGFVISIDDYLTTEDRHRR